MRRNEYRRIFPGTSSRQRRSALDVHGGWLAAVCGGVVVCGHCCATTPFAFLPFLFPSPTWILFLRKDRDGEIRQAGRGNWEGRLVAPAVHAHCPNGLWLAWVDTPMSPLKRLSSLGCCEASGTPVTDCLAPEHAPALALTGAHEKKRGTCCADFPRVSCPRCHGPSVPHSSTVPNNSRTFRIPPIVSTFLLLVKEERVCLASTRSSLVDCRQKTMARPPPSCF